MLAWGRERGGLGYFTKEHPLILGLLKIYVLTDVYEFSWCRERTDLLAPGPQDVLNSSCRKPASEKLMPRCIRQVGVSANRRAHEQMRH